MTPSVAYVTTIFTFNYGLKVTYCWDSFYWKTNWNISFFTASGRGAVQIRHGIGRPSKGDPQAIHLRGNAAFQANKRRRVDLSMLVKGSLTRTQNRHALIIISILAKICIVPSDRLWYVRSVPTNLCSRSTLVLT